MRQAASLVLIAGVLLAPSGFAPAREKAAKAGGSEPSLERLVRQLADSDFGKREAAFKALQAAGTRALPALRKGLKDPDIEVRKRAGRLVAAIEARLAFAPTLVTLNAKDRSVHDVLNDLTRRTDYRFLFVGGGGNDNPCTLRVKKVPFWEALDKVCARTGMVIEIGQGGPYVYLSVEEAPRPRVHYDRAFRTVVNGFARKPARGTDLTLGLTLYGEPKLMLLAVGPAKIEKAHDQDGRSMLPPVRKGEPSWPFVRNGAHQYLGEPFDVGLVRPSAKSKSLKFLKGSLPVFAVVRRKDEVVTDKMKACVGKTFRVGRVSLRVVQAEEAPEGQFNLTLDMTNEDAANGFDPTWEYTVDGRVFPVDAKGERLFSEGSSSWFHRGPGDGRLTRRFRCNLHKPVKLIYQHWHVLGTRVAFEFKDIPLPGPPPR